MSKRKLSLAECTTIMIFVDLLVVVMSTVVAMWIWSFSYKRAILSLPLMLNSHTFLTILLWVMVAIVFDSYNSKNMNTLMDLLRQPLQISLLTLFVYFVMYFFAPVGSLPRLPILFFIAISCPLLLICHFIYFKIFSTTQLRNKILLIGSQNATTKIEKLIKIHAPSFYEIIGKMEIGDVTSSSLVERDVSNIICMDNKQPKNCSKIFAMAANAGIAVIPVAKFYEQLTRRCAVDFMHGCNVGEISFHGKQPNEPYLFVKRAIDIVVALFGLAVTGILLPFVYLAIKLDSPGPVLFSQLRIGQNGKRFKLWKFRTMMHNHSNINVLWTLENDKRITRVGRTMRKLYFDELPQLWNLLKGDMSLVGIRPLVVDQCEIFAREIPFHDLRHLVKPGLTGWAVINYKHVNSISDAKTRLEYDLYYVKYQSIWLDLFVIFRTSWNIMLMKGMC